jgi:hypothetical protein
MARPSEYNYKLYGLKDPVTGKTRYIGYTSKTLNHRLKYHIYDCKKSINSHKVNWINTLLKLNLKPIIFLIDTKENLEDILKLEKYYISLIPNLVNSTSGGETNKTYLPEVLEKMSVNRKGKCIGSENPMFGKKRPDVSERNKIFSLERNLKIKNTQLKKYSDLEYRKSQITKQKTCIKISAYKDDVFYKSYKSKRELALDLNLDRKSVNCFLNGLFKQVKGYTFKLN